MDQCYFDRRNIINFFYNRHRAFHLEPSEHHLTIIRDKFDASIFIEYNSYTNDIAFNLGIDVTYPLSGIRKTSAVVIYLSGDGSLQMIDTTANSLEERLSSGNRVNDPSISKIPENQEELFQLSTSDNLILRLDDYAKITEMVEYIRGFGRVIKTRTWSVDLRFR